eukprot:CAMPEP_0206632088 /NCGR_PEP_ID=MMETSP0325_2-20121206/68678_1 /ASSEMBLY_ACC=CAM_ASM_000347 /TAXON_ID=2866 /ORGANISM="Crypthecodinium cohnii, Strain Seligo" /LENGTH=698 /DNA_ID=CAMNT_0054157507 /DNA_START=76 /DNA_END=2168 /DNA_ORIENTATION=+
MAHDGNSDSRTTRESAEDVEAMGETTVEGVSVTGQCPQTSTADWLLEMEGLAKAHQLPGGRSSESQEIAWDFSGPTLLSWETALRQRVETTNSANNGKEVVAIAREALLALKNNSGSQRTERMADDSPGDQRENVAKSILARAVVLSSSSDSSLLAEALAAGGEAAAAFGRMGDVRRQAMAILDVASLRTRKGELTTASLLYQDVVRLTRETAELHLQAMALFELAKLHHRSSELHVALSEAKDARNCFEQAGEQTEVVRVLLLISTLHRDLENFPKAETAAGLARELAQASKDRAGEALALLGLADLRLRFGREEQEDHGGSASWQAARAAALRTAEQAQAAVQNPTTKAERESFDKIIHWKADVHFELHQAAEALKTAKTGQSILKKHKSTTEQEKARVKLLSAEAKLALLWDLDLGTNDRSEAAAEAAVTRRLRRELEGAIRTGELAVRLARPTDDRVLLASALHTLGQMYYFGSRFSDALLVAAEAAASLEADAKSVLELRALVLSAQCHAALGETEAAMHCLGEAMQAAGQLGPESGALEDELHALELDLLQTSSAAADTHHLKVTNPAASDELEGSAAAESATPPSPPADAAAAAAAAAAVVVVDEEAVRQTVEAMIKASALTTEDLEDETPLMDSGLDSLSSVELRTRLESEFSLKLGVTVIYNFPTIGALTRHIIEECHAQAIAWNGAYT